jgi:hypothetical protein
MSWKCATHAVPMSSLVDRSNLALVGLQCLRLSVPFLAMVVSKSGNPEATRTQEETSQCSVDEAMRSISCSRG